MVYPVFYRINGAMEVNVIVVFVDKSLLTLTGFLPRVPNFVSAEGNDSGPPSQAFTLQVIDLP